MFQTPILFIIYNRPDVSMLAFDQIRKTQPKRLFIAADGAKEAKDIELCEQTRSRVLQAIDWDCEVYKKFEEQNLGCGVGPSSAISWFFEHVDSGIILEDDLVPHDSFFDFCAVLLSRYAKDKRVYSITGVNWQNGLKRGDASYFFSRYPGIWGWATWKDRWSDFNIDLQDLDEFISSKKIRRVTRNPLEINYHLKTFKEADKGHIWDYQWKYTVFVNEGLCIVPNVNLVSNIGFGENGTHTKDPNHWRARQDTYEVQFPLVHPKAIRAHRKADYLTAQNIFFRKSLWRRVAHKLERTLKVLIRKINFQ